MYELMHAKLAGKLNGFLGFQQINGKTCLVN